MVRLLCDSDMSVFRILFFIKVALSAIECRVFCQDAHASPWIPLGYSCPVMCQNIVSAIEKLKVMDYRNILESGNRNKQNMDGNYINRVINSLSSESRETDKHQLRDGMIDNKNFHLKNTNRDEQGLPDQAYVQKNKVRQKSKWKTINNPMNDIQRYENVFEKPTEIGFGAKIQDGVRASYNYGGKYENQHADLRPAIPNYVSSVHSNKTGRYKADFNIKKNNDQLSFIKMAGNLDQLEAALNNVLENTSCDWSMGQSYVLIKKILRRCVVGSRKNGYGDDFLRTLTKTMNRFSEASFEFTEDMVELMLQRVFGESKGRSGDVFDLGKLLHFLRNAVKVHKLHRQKQTTIVLKPRHCLSVSMPGCFCRPGFVEKSGQCVQPADCFTESSNQVYLTRIIVH